MNTKNEVFEYLIDQLRQQLPVIDVMGEIKRWSIDRSIAGRGNYTDEENAVIDAYIGLEHNPYKQQCEDLAHEVQSLKNQLRDMSAQIKELHLALVRATGDAEAYKLVCKQEQSGCRKDDTQECAHEWCFYDGGALMMCRICGLKSPNRQKEDTQKCPHSFYYVITDGSAPFGTKVCKTCGEYF